MLATKHTTEIDETIDSVVHNRQSLTIDELMHCLEEKHAKMMQKKQWNQINMKGIYNDVTNGI